MNEDLGDVVYELKMLRAEVKRLTDTLVTVKVKSSGSSGRNKIKIKFNPPVDPDTMKGIEAELDIYFDTVLGGEFKMGAVTVTDVLKNNEMSKKDRPAVKQYLLDNHGTPSTTTTYWAIDCDGVEHNVRKRCAFYGPIPL